MTSPAVAPALYRCTVAHVRTAPVRHALRHRTYLWCVDLDRLPRLPRALRPLARFDPRDHFDGTAPTLRAGVEHYLAAQGVAPPDGPVLMLAHARVLMEHSPADRQRSVEAEALAGPPAEGESAHDAAAPLRAVVLDAAARTRQSLERVGG